MSVETGIEAPAPYAPDLGAGSARKIPGLWPYPEYANPPYEGISSILRQPRRAAAASPAEQAGTSPNWPVLPSGYSGNGQWTGESRSVPYDPHVMSDVTPDNEWKPGAQYAARPRRGQRGIEPEPGQAVRLIEAQARADRAIARVREFDPNWRPRPSIYEGIEGRIRAYESEAEEAEARLREITKLNFLSTVPQERPPTTKERNDAAREIARWLARNHNQVIEGVSWLLELEPSIQAYLDEPKSLEELQRAVSYPRQGSDIHHIVEKTSAEEDGFPKWMIHGPENLIRIPRFKHWEITSWYMTKNENYGGLSPRDYLHGKDWDERRRVGLDALVRHGVLK
jgi:hypothetical protein